MQNDEIKAIDNTLDIANQEELNIPLVDMIDNLNKNIETIIEEKTDIIKPKKKYIYVKKTATTKMCKICNIEKLLELFNVNHFLV